MQYPTRKQRVLLALGTGREASFVRGLAFGVTDFIADGQWSWIPVFSNDPKAQSNVEGAIGLASQPELKRCIREGLPTVVLLDRLAPDIPSVTLDNLAVGRTAAKHLIDLGVDRLAYIGSPPHSENADRRDGFVQTAQAHHIPCQICPVRTIEGNQRQITDWLNTLAKPVGIMAFNDDIAVRVLHAAQQLKLDVPFDLAVVGVDNDEMHCVLSDPQLSSVLIPHRRLGHIAAELMNDLLRGIIPRPIHRVLAPMDVISRASSDIAHTHQPVLRNALNYLREHALQHISVKSVAAELGVSRRWLELAFARVIGRTPAQEIQRIRLQHAKELLASSDLSIARIAHKCGFTNGAHLSVVFRRVFQQTPRQFRDTQATR